MKRTMPLMMLPDYVDRTVDIDNRRVTPGAWLGRYVEHAGTCNYTLWKGDKMESRYMTDGTQPEWLTTITNAAKLGGYEQYVPNPPPSVVVWFEVDDKRQLVQFIERGKHHVS